MPTDNDQPYVQHATARSSDTTVCLAMFCRIVNEFFEFKRRARNATILIWPGYP